MSLTDVSARGLASGARLGVGAVLYAVYWRSLAWDEWRLHSQHLSSTEADEERERLAGQHIAGWRAEQTLVLQCAPGRAPKPCLVLEERDAAPPLVPPRIDVGRRWARPFTKAQQTRRAWKPLRIVDDELDDEPDADPGWDEGGDDAPPIEADFGGGPAIEAEFYDEARADAQTDYDDEVA